jgi:cyclohexanone monooxygenase
VQRADRAVDVVVVGAGISGLYLLHRLRGLRLDVQVLDEAGGVGGTWYWNRYPGARCDIESMTYSYSFSDELQEEWSWTERYAAQPEILRYLEHVAERFDLMRDIRLSTRVTRAQWDAETARWTVETDAGDALDTAFLVFATGCLSVPVMPTISGLDRYRGVAHHTARWPHEGVDVTGKRVAVIGTGSSAVQAVPVLAETAAEVVVYQRTPPFSVPAWNGPIAPEVEADWKARYPELRALARTTGAGNPWNAREERALDATPEQREHEFAERYARGGFHIHSAYADLFTDPEANEILSDYVRERIRERVHDPALAELLCPYEYPLATKRMCIDTGYYEAYNRDNVKLVGVKQTPIEEFTEQGLRVGGVDEAFDVIVLATGFDAMTGALQRVDIRGRDGETLREKWREGARSFLGLALAGFPNLFTITGPLSPSVLSNMMVSIEQHVDLVARCIAEAHARGADVVEATPEAEEAWVEHAREVGDASLYPRASSWYMGANIPGKPRVLLPYVGGVGAYRLACERVVADGYAGFAFGAAGSRASARTAPSASSAVAKA